MNKDLFAGLFFGGLIAMTLMGTLMVWNLEVLAPMFYVMGLNIIMTIIVILEKQ